VNPLLKKIAGAWAVKEAVEYVQDRRQPKRSVFSKLSSVLVLGAIGGAGYYLYKNGKLGPLVEKVDGLRSSSSNNTSSTTDAFQSA
jgi:hypothetical protein